MFRKSVQLFAMFLLLTTSLIAQEKNDVRLGLNVYQFHRDFGLGIHANSPYFIKQKTAIRLGANIQWLQHHNDLNEMTWTPYGNTHN